MVTGSLALGLSRRRWSKRDILLGCLSLLATAAICVYVLLNLDEVRHFSRYGYLGVFLTSILAGVTILVPVPGVLVTFTMGAVLNPILVGLVAGVGEALGSMGIYLAGISNSRNLHALDHGVMAKFRNWIKTRGALSVFIMSAIFNPLFFPFTALAGMMHFGWWRFFILCMSGKAFKNTLVAAAGYYGVGALLNIFGGQSSL